MNSKLVSIVLPTFNGERYISKAIDSCINQTYKHFELIIIDDCSTDNTYSIIKKYSELDKRIKIIRNNVNRKLPSSLNIGFKQAKGYYYTWISDDNMFKDNFLEEMVKFLDNKHSVDLVYSDFTIIDKNDCVIDNLIMRKSSKLIFYNVVSASFMYKAIIHKKIGGFDEKLFLIEDYDFWLRAYKYFKFEKLDCNLYYYRTHSKSLTSRNAKSISKLRIILLYKRINMLKNINKDKRAVAYLKLSEDAKYIKDHKLAFLCFFKALCLSPKKIYTWNSALKLYIIFGSNDIVVRTIFEAIFDVKKT